jgi:hypothetical protein
VYGRITNVLHNPRFGSPGRWGGVAPRRRRGDGHGRHAGAVLLVLFIVWIVKLTLIRYGGIQAYRLG